MALESIDVKTSVLTVWDMSHVVSALILLQKLFVPYVVDLLMAYSHCRIRTRIRTRTRIPNPMDTLYYAEVFTLVRIRTRIPVQTNSQIVTVPILGVDPRPNKPVHTTFSCFCLHVFPFLHQFSSAKMARYRVLSRKARKMKLRRR